MPQFRPEVARAHRQQAQVFGDVMLSTPIHHRLYGACGALVGIGLVLLLTFGQYSRRINVAGQLLPEQGVIRLSAQGTGTLVQAYAREGEVVAQGAMLFSLQNPRHSSDGGDAGADSLRTVLARRDAIKTEIEATSAIQDYELVTVRSKLAGLEKSKTNLARQLTIANERHQLARDMVEKFARLAATGFVSGEQQNQKQKEMLEQSLAVTMLERQSQELDEALLSTRKELAALPLKQANARSTLFRSDQEVKHELVAENTLKGSAIMAPVAGRLTAIMVKPGNLIGPGQTVATLIPNNSPLQANLYVPSRGIGFITEGARVYLRYRAFPYQKFGQAKGTVVDISATSMRADELDNGARASELALAVSSEPVYRVRVALDSQHVAAGARKIELRAGTLLDADILLDRKPLYQWILDPIDKFTTGLNL